MAAHRYLCASLLVLLATQARAGEALDERLVAWHADDRRPLAEEPAERDPSLVWDFFGDAVAEPLERGLDPVRLLRRASVPFGGNHVGAARDINRLDEVPNSAWFTNRLGLYPLSPEDLRRGPGGGGPDRSEPWTIVKAKTEGVTPGFTIEDARGDRYLIKFDAPGHLGISSAAAVISQRILHAAGYFVPDDNVVVFEAEDLRLGSGVEMTLPDGSEREMREEDVLEILDRVDRLPDGRIRAISSAFLPGRPLGPFRFRGLRKDDPNDQIPHEHRRTLRGLSVFAAWLNHFDTKQHNTLDMLIEEEGGSFIRHYLIDFASTLGTGADGPAPRFGWEYTLDPLAFTRRTLNLGLAEDDWRRVRRPEGLDEISFFDHENFDPMGFRPLQPNPAFVNLTRRDGYWAAKIISAFSDEHLRAMVAEADYRNPAAAEYMVEILASRRDKIARAWFGKVAPLDFFTLADARFDFHDLGIERELYAKEGTSYSYRVRIVDADRNTLDQTEWSETRETQVDLSASTMEARFVAIDLRLSRQGDSSGGPTVFVAPRLSRVLEVRR